MDQNSTYQHYPLTFVQNLITWSQITRMTKECNVRIITMWPGHSLRERKANEFCGYLLISSVQFSSVTQLCPTLCNPMNHSMPGLPVYHQLPEFTQTHVHRVSDAIQPSHPLSSPSPTALNPSQHQSHFQ